MIHFSSKCEDEKEVLYATIHRLKTEQIMDAERCKGEISCLKQKILALTTNTHFDPDLIKDEHTLSTSDSKILRG